MSSYTGYVSSGPKDYDDGGNSGTTILCYDTNSVGDQLAHAQITTSGITAGANITAATLHYYHESYTKDKDDGYDRLIWSICGATTQTFYNNTDVPGLSGWKNVELDEEALTHIGDAGTVGDGVLDGELKIRFNCGDGDINQQWRIRAYEYPTSPDYALELYVEYDDPPPARRRIFLIT